MKSEELRIGNWINVFGFEENGIQKQTHSSDVSICELNPSLYEPIPLTKEWLIKFGFKDLGYGEFEKEQFLVDSEYTDKGEWEFCHLGKRLCTIYFVHQLQNLYFALNGKELIQKPHHS